MSKKTFLRISSLLASGVGIMFLWGKWVILMGILFLIWGNNLQEQAEKEPQ